MAGGHGSLGLLALLWLFMSGFLPIHLPVWTLNLQTGTPTVYSGPHGSYFGFALDFYQDSKGSMNVVVGAPRANTSQPGVMEAGSVYLCPWVPSGSKCTPIEFDTKGDQVMESDPNILEVFKSKQWFGASVNTWEDNILACAPLQHWNALEGQEEATKTPVGSCFLASESLRHFSEYSPCRETQIEPVYSAFGYRNDKRYCEIGFSASISKYGSRGRHCLGHLADITLEVEILTLKYVFQVLWTIHSEQIASYFGHTVAVADINGDGKDDILVGAPLFLERHSDLKLYEVGRVYLYLQRKTRNAYKTPWQTLTGTDVYGRFGMAIALLGDTDQDGYIGRDEGGRVYIYHGCSEGLSTSPKQILENPFSGPAGFGFAIRGASDVDGNGYPDVLVGAYRVSKVVVYRAQPVVVVKAQLALPVALNPENKTCGAPGAQASCFTIQMCVGVSGKSMPQKIEQEVFLFNFSSVLFPAWLGLRNEGSLLIGADNVLLIQATAVNDGEGAYETELVAELPAGAYFQRANSSTQKLICNSRKENETHLVACEVGDPMKAGTEIKVDVELSVSQLENAGDTISFVLQLKSKNTLNSSSNVVRLPVPVKAVAEMELLGISAPAAIVLPVTTEDYKNKSKKLQNAGPSTVSGAELLVDFPNKFGEGFLLYITKVSTEGNITCSPMNETNPLKLELQEAMTTPSSNVTGQRGRWRQRRDVSPAMLEEPVLVINEIYMLSVAIVLLQRPLEQFLIQSQAQFNASGMPYHIRPEVLPSGSSLAKTLVERVNPDAEREIPVWWIIVAVLVGLLLLVAFIIILWKTGFFKRKRPPTEDEEQLTNEHGAQSTGEGQ
ncbi:hypothetical protein JD844_002277 [Phrynosoma platyrhinos]|uniref:Integrin alpha-2 domain-containing protein n=1 Tax=Phrynosoma platyrhinos TaxID=52577 RepID=A0ABQ7TB56_PHRPL|nr:hypothetical protein JD844_002277 [Phrynosoma platyrhinos]